MKNRELMFLGLAMMAGTTIMTLMIMYFGEFYTSVVLVGNPNAAIFGYTIVALGLLVGAFAYPIAGHISDNLFTRFGRRRPFFFFAVPCAVGLVFAVFPSWIQPLFNFSATINYVGGCIFILIFYIILVFLWRLVQCPFLALFVDVTEPDERVKASVFLNFCDLGGVVVGFMLPLLFGLEHMEYAVYILGVFYVIAFLGAFFLGPKEDLEQIKELHEKKEKGGFLSSMKEILKVDILRNYIIAGFFFVFCFNLAIQYVIPYLNFIGLTTDEMILYAIPLMIFVAILFLVVSRLSKKWGKMATFRKSLLWGALATPLLLIIGITDWGPITVLHQLFIVFFLLAGAIVGLLIFSYAIMMDLGKQVPGKESLFVGVYVAIQVFSAPLAAFVMGALRQYVNPINVGIWNGNLGFGLVGVITGIAFLISYLFIRKVKYEVTSEEEEETLPKDPELIEKVEEICKDKTPFKHIQAMDYPRMAGTPEDDRAVDYIGENFRNYGFEPKFEEFYLPETSKLSKSILPILLIGWGIFSYYNIMYMPYPLRNIFGVLLLLVPVLVFIMILKIEVIFKRMISGNYKKIQRLTKQIEEGTYKKPIKKGRNVFVEYIPEEYEDHLYLTAHHDSTTLRFNMKWIKIFIVIGVLAGIIYVISYLSHYFLLIYSGFDLFGTYPQFFLILLIIFLVAVSFFLFSRIFRTNESHGAIDNLTGTSLVLELANIAKLINPKLKITFIVFAAEEVGLYGSAYHYNIHKKEFETKKVHVVSIDMVGEMEPLALVNKIKPILSIPMEPEFNSQMIELAQRLGIEIRLIPFFYPGSDFANWLLNGHPVNWAITPSKKIHSPQDISQNVNQKLLNQCLKLFTAYLLEKSK